MVPNGALTMFCHLQRSSTTLIAFLRKHQLPKWFVSGATEILNFLLPSDVFRASWRRLGRALLPLRRQYHLPEQDFDWTHPVYGDVTELLPEDAPPALGRYVRLYHYVDANLYHDLITGRSVTGIRQPDDAKTLYRCRAMCPEARCCIHCIIVVVVPPSRCLSRL